MIISATGHRPNKLGGYGHATFTALTAVARDYLESQPDITEAVSGMALGWDQAFAQAAINLRIPLHAAVPFADQDCKWPEPSRKYYRTLLFQASEVTTVCDGTYAAWKMQKRNEWMVDRADRIAALWDGTPGGTANCIAYAEKQAKPIDNLIGLYRATIGSF